MKIKALTREEEEALYGKRKIEIGKCFARNEHMYMQRKYDVLHITNGVINTLPQGFLNDKSDLTEIENVKFIFGIKKEIYEMEIDNFWDQAFHQ